MVSEEIELNMCWKRKASKSSRPTLANTSYSCGMRGRVTSSRRGASAKGTGRGIVPGKTRHSLHSGYSHAHSTARKILREVFLTADVGLSGVNFGVAETGGLCIVTNEGNARMVTTLPPVHIALMGMERLVPNLNDLALMLSLLPRSATDKSSRSTPSCFISRFPTNNVT